MFGADCFPDGADDLPGVVSEGLHTEPGIHQYLAALRNSTDFEGGQIEQRRSAREQVYGLQNGDVSPCVQGSGRFDQDAALP
jgi:hypothetical protein